MQQRETVESLRTEREKHNMAAMQMHIKLPKALLHLRQCVRASVYVYVVVARTIIFPLVCTHYAHATYIPAFPCRFYSWEVVQYRMKSSV